MKKAAFFLLGSGAALILGTPLKKVAREAAIGVFRAGRGMSRALAGIKEDLEDVEAEARAREEARTSRRAVNTDTSVS